MSTEISATKSPAPQRTLRADSIRMLEQEASYGNAPSPSFSNGSSLRTPMAGISKRGSSVYSMDEKPLPVVKFRDPLVAVNFNQDDSLAPKPSPLRMSKSYPVLSQYHGEDDDHNSCRSSFDERIKNIPPLLMKKPELSAYSRENSDGAPFSRRKALSMRLKGISRKSFSTVRLHSRFQEDIVSATTQLDIRESEPGVELRTLEPMPHSLTQEELEHERRVLARALSENAASMGWARRTAKRVFSGSKKEIEEEAERIFGPPEIETLERDYDLFDNSSSTAIRGRREVSNYSKNQIFLFTDARRGSNDAAGTNFMSSTGHGFVFDPFREFNSVQVELKNNTSNGRMSNELSVDTIRKIYLRLLMEHVGQDWIKMLRELRRMSLVELERLALQTFRILTVQPMVSKIDFHGFFRHHTYPTFLKWVHCKKLTITVSEKADCFAVYQHVKTIGERVFVYSTRCPFDKTHDGPRTVAPYFVGYLEVGHKVLGNIVADVAITPWGDTKVLLAVLTTDGRVNMTCFNIPKTRLAPENGQLDWNDRSVRAAPTAYTMFVPRQQCDRIKFTRDASLLLFSNGTITVHNYNSHERFSDGEQRQMVYRFANYTGHKTVASSFDRESAMSYIMSIDVDSHHLINNRERIVMNNNLTSIAHDSKLYMVPGCYRPVLLAGDLTRAAIITTLNPPAIKIMRSSYFWYNETHPRVETRVYDWQLRIPSYGRGAGIGVDTVHSYTGAWLRRDGHAYDSTEIIIAVAFWNGEVWIFGADGGTVKGYDPLYVEDGREWRGVVEPNSEYLQHLAQEARLVSEPTQDQLTQNSVRARSFSGDGPVPLVSNPAAANTGFSDCPRLLQGRLLVKLKSTPQSIHFEVPQNSSIEFKQYGRTGLVINTSDRTIERYYFSGFGGEVEYHGEVWNENWTLSTIPDEKNSDVYHSVNGIYRKGPDQVVGVQVAGNNWII